MTEDKHDGGRRRRAILMFLPLFLLAAAGCFWLLFANVSLGEAESFIPAPLGSDALANYGKDKLPGRLRSLSISIVKAVIRDREPEGEDAGARAADVSESLKSPVPTVTPKPGDPTGTPTVLPTATSTPDLLGTGTATATVSPSPSPSPSRTPTPTKTDVPAAGPTSTPGPSATPSKTPTKTATATWTPTPCKVPPEIQIVLPVDGTVYGPGSSILGQALAWDPDNVNPSNCAPSPVVDGAGIQLVEFEVEWVDAGPTPVVVYSRTENTAMYCAYLGSGACQTVSVDGGQWPDSSPINNGLHRLRAKAKDDEGVYSSWVTVDFTIILPTPTPTPTFTPVPPTPTVDPCSGISLTGFNKGGSEAWVTLTNGPASTIEIDQIDVSWGFTADLSAIQLAGIGIWGGDLPSPVSITTGWSGSVTDRELGPNSSGILKFTFESGAAASGYSIYVHFTNSCDTSFSN